MPDDGTRDNAYGLNETQALKQPENVAVDEDALAAAPEPLSLEEKVHTLELRADSLDAEFDEIKKHIAMLTDLVGSGFDSMRANLAKMEPMAAELKGHAMGLMDTVKAEFAKAHDAINERLIALETRRHIRGQTP